jgi:hypothetical protein
MPYIEQNVRMVLDPKIDALQPDTAGDLNYAITRLCFSWFKRNGGRYLQIAIVMGTFVCAAFEFYRRVAAPYEDKKCAENGDVY